MDYRIKDLPKEERPREKLRKKGVSSLNRVELLSIILRTGTSGKNVKELSAEILNSYSLSSLADRTSKELEMFDGVSKVKAGQLLAASELARRLQNSEKEKIKSLSDLKSQVQDMKFLEREKVRVFMLSSGNEVVGVEEFEGEVGSAGFSVQKLFREALNRNAAAIILAHNHPSGKSKATEQDLKTTKEVKKLADQLGLSLLDHIIIGEKAFSMKAEGLL